MRLRDHGTVADKFSVGGELGEKVAWKEGQERTVPVCWGKKCVMLWL